jgi:hypothetical protein
VFRIRRVRNPSFADLEPALRLADGPEKTAAVVSWFQGLYAGQPGIPVLVGEGAMELHSDGAYSADVLELAGELPPGVVRRLRAAGFLEEEGLWIHENGDVILEVNPPRPQGAGTTLTLPYGTGDVQVLRAEEVLLDLLAAWRQEESPLDAIAAFQFWRRLWEKMDLERLETEAARRGLAPALESLRQFDTATGGLWPDLQELRLWAAQPA